MIPVFYNISQSYDSNGFLDNNNFQLLKNDIVMEIYDPYLPKSALNSWKDKKADKIYTCNFLEQQDFIVNRWIPLFNMFKNSFEEKKELFKNIQSDTILNDFNQSLFGILVLYPETISVGVSDDECVYIYFEKNNKSVNFDLFFEPDKPTEVAVTVFENIVSKLSFTDYLDNSINILKKEFITADGLSYSSLAKI